MSAWPVRAWLALSTFAAALVAMPEDVAAASLAPSPPARLYREGLRWLGTSATCVDIGSWKAERLFSLSRLPSSLALLCLYRWNTVGAPLDADIAQLFSSAGSADLTEDVPVAYPLDSGGEAEEAFYAGLRGSLAQHVGGAPQFPVIPLARQVRIAVIDTAPNSPHAAIAMGPSRHGDTLAHLIEDLVCEPLRCAGTTCTSQEVAARRCAAEVTTSLALPWSADRIYSPSGGHVGTLSDVARAVAHAFAAWQAAGGQQRLILNMSIGWEHTPGIADCSANATEGPPSRAVKGILRHVAGAGALIITAAGNDSGGATPRTGLLCPALYQTIPQAASPTRPLVVAVSGVDYSDHVLETARVQGTTAISALGLGGVAWIPGQPRPPQLVGSSVSSAVVAGMSALVWAAKPGFSSKEVWLAVYEGGVYTGASTAPCPVGLTGCTSRRASTCGALISAGVATSCTLPSPKSGSSPVLDAEIAALEAVYEAVAPGVSAVAPMNPSTVPRYMMPSVQVEPSVFPQPISATCPTCFVSSGGSTSSGPQVTIPALGAKLFYPVLVVRDDLGTLHSVTLTFGAGPIELDAGVPYAFPVPINGYIRAAYLTGFSESYSVTEQIFVAQ